MKVDSPKSPVSEVNTAVIQEPAEPTAVLQEPEPACVT